MYWTLLHPAAVLADVSFPDISVVYQMVLTLVGRSADTIELEGEAFSVDDYQVAKDKGCTFLLTISHYQANIGM